MEVKQRRRFKLRTERKDAAGLAILIAILFVLSGAYGQIATAYQYPDAYEYKAERLFGALATTVVGPWVFYLIVLVHRGVKHESDLL